MALQIVPLVCGVIEENAWLVSREGREDCVLIDPGDDIEKLKGAVRGRKLQAILLTHGHYDHVGAVDAVAEETGAEVYLNPLDTADGSGDYHFPYTLPAGGHPYGDGDTVDVAGLHFNVLGTPGHTRGGVTLRCENALFTGDTLFKGSCGRTDLPGGDMEEELQSLKRICSLPGDYEVYPGHMDSSTLERERMFNYYCRAAMSR